MNQCSSCQRYPRPVVGNTCQWCGCSIFNQQKALMHGKKCPNKPRDCDGVLWCCCQQMKASEEDGKFILEHTMARWQRIRASCCWASQSQNPVLFRTTTQPFSGLPNFSKSKDKLCYNLYECVCVVWMWWVLI